MYVCMYVYIWITLMKWFSCVTTILVSDSMSGSYKVTGNEYWLRKILLANAYNIHH